MLMFKVDRIRDHKVGIVVYPCGEAAVSYPTQQMEFGSSFALEPVDQDRARADAVEAAEAIGQRYIPVEIEDRDLWTGVGPFLLTF